MCKAISFEWFGVIVCTISMLCGEHSGLVWALGFGVFCFGWGLSRSGHNS